MKYTIKNVIIDADEAKDLVGKYVWGGVIPYDTVMFANGDIGNRRPEKLTKIDRYSDHPFKTKDAAYPCIIPVEDTKLLKALFSSAEEFLRSYKQHVPLRNNNFVTDTLYKDGIWLISEGEYLQVGGIDNTGVWTPMGFIKWRELFERYSFLDGSPCGVMEVLDGEE